MCELTNQCICLGAHVFQVPIAKWAALSPCGRECGQQLFTHPSSEEFTMRSLWSMYAPCHIQVICSGDRVVWCYYRVKMGKLEAGWYF